MDLVELTPALGESIARNAPPELLPVHHPVWLDVLSSLGEDARGLVALDAGEVRGWLLYTVTRRDDVTVVNSLPYIAYGGPHARDAETTDLLLLGLREIAQSLGADVLSVGTSPLLTEEEELAYVAAIAPTHIFENGVQLQPLDPHPLEQLSKKRRDAIESEIRRGERAGLVAIDRLDDAQLEEWLDIYRARYAEIGAAPYPDEFHRQLHRRTVPAGIAELRGLVDATGRLLGGIAFLVSQREATYFSSAFVSDVRHLYPTTFLLNHAFHAFRARGIRTFNWHSSPSQGGVHAYKQRWGAADHRHFYLAALLRPDTRLFELSADEIRMLFPFRFVLPFSAWKR
ncbi:MAG TPA: GNAT family N-acetyltransferase [Thermoanaerobaculia bacterium]|nr:GNAT family N-acetyltransferase [Thermoanaerobaculia bacterium]